MYSIGWSFFFPVNNPSAGSMQLSMRSYFKVTPSFQHTHHTVPRTPYSYRTP